MSKYDLPNKKSFEFEIKPDEKTREAMQKELVEPMPTLRKRIIEDMLRCDAIEQTEKLQFRGTLWTEEQIKQFKELMVKFSYDSMCIGWNRCFEFCNQQKEQNTMSKFRKQ